MTATPKITVSSSCVYYSISNNPISVTVNRKNYNRIHNPPILQVILI